MGPIRAIDCFCGEFGKKFLPSPSRLLAHELGHGYTHLNGNYEGYIRNNHDAVKYENTISKQLDRNAPVRAGKPGWISLSDRIVVDGFEWKHGQRVILAFEPEDLRKNWFGAKRLQQFTVSGNGVQDALIVTKQGARKLAGSPENSESDAPILLVVFAPEALYVANFRKKVLLAYTRL